MRSGTVVPRSYEKTKLHGDARAEKVDDVRLQEEMFEQRPS